MIVSSGPVIIPHWSFTSGPSVRPCLRAGAHAPSTTTTAAIVVRFNALQQPSQSCSRWCRVVDALCEPSSRASSPSPIPTGKMLSDRVLGKPINNTDLVAAIDQRIYSLSRLLSFSVNGPFSALLPTSPFLFRTRSH